MITNHLYNYLYHHSPRSLLQQSRQVGSYITGIRNYITGNYLLDSIQWKSRSHFIRKNNLVLPKVRMTSPSTRAITSQRVSTPEHECTTLTKLAVLSVKVSRCNKETYMFRLNHHYSRTIYKWPGPFIIRLVH